MVLYITTSDKKEDTMINSKTGGTKEDTMKDKLILGLKTLGKASCNGAELAAVGRGQEAAYNKLVKMLKINTDLANDPGFKALVKLVTASGLFVGASAFEEKMPHLKHIKPICELSVTETVRENTDMVMMLLQEVGMAMYQAYLQPERPPQKIRVDIPLNDLKVSKLRSIAKEKGLRGYSSKKRDELIEMLQEEETQMVEQPLRH